MKAKYKFQNKKLAKYPNGGSIVPLSPEYVQDTYNNYYDSLHKIPLVDNRNGSTFDDDGFDFFRDRYMKTNHAFDNIFTRDLSSSLANNYANKDQPMYSQIGYIPKDFDAVSWTKNQNDQENIRYNHLNAPPTEKEIKYGKEGHRTPEQEKLYKEYLNNQPQKGKYGGKNEKRI